MRFELKILGSNSAIPSHNRNPSSQLLSYHSSAYLIDCGEGTQSRMSQYKVKRSKIKHIFISHLHGDHIFGLPGLITSYALLGREDELQIHGPVGLKRFMDTVLNVSESYLSYKLHINEFEPIDYRLVFEDQYMAVYSFPMQHRITTSGYRFIEKHTTTKLDAELIRKYNLSGVHIKQLKEGASITSESGDILKYQDLVLDVKPKRSYSYCSDTIYDEGLIEYINGSDLLYHEATYLDDMKAQAKERMHSTAKEAAQIALQANVERLIIGHYSSRYKEVQPLLAEASSVFPNTSLAIEGETHEISYKN